MRSAFSSRSHELSPRLLTSHNSSCARGSVPQGEAAAAELATSASTAIAATRARWAFRGLQQHSGMTGSAKFLLLARLYTAGDSMRRGNLHATRHAVRRVQVT